MINPIAFITQYILMHYPTIQLIRVTRGMVNHRAEWHYVRFDQEFESTLGELLRHYQPSKLAIGYPEDLQYVKLLFLK